MVGGLEGRPHFALGECEGEATHAGIRWLISVEA